jgi:hypothetical protein
MHTIHAHTYQLALLIDDCAEEVDSSMFSHPWIAGKAPHGFRKR